MSDFKTQRNVAIGVAALAVAFAAGYVISGRGGDDRSSAPSPESVAEPSIGAEGASEAASPAADPNPPAEEAAPAAVTDGSREQRPVRATAPRPQPDREEPAVATPPAEPMPETPPAAAPDRPVVRVERVTIPASTGVVMELLNGVSSQSAQIGDEVVAELVEPIRVAGETVVPAGTRLVGRVSEAQALRKVGGKAILGISFDRLESSHGGAAIAASFRREGRSETGKDAATIAAGAVIGTILGNQAKSNDRGKVIGAAVGAAAGTAVASKTPGETIELPAGARLELTLRDGVDLTVDRD